jgi:hypothetical protein
MITAVLLAAAAALAPTPLRACASARLPTGLQMDSLLVAAQRAARAWRRHDFAALFTAEGEVRLQLPGTAPTGPLRAAQAAELLRAFAGGATEESAEVAVVRRVDPDRAYVEVERRFTVRGTSAWRSQTVYLGMRWEGSGYRVVEIRVVPQATLH